MEDIILEKFKRLFRDADLQKIISMGAPPDEYDGEALYLYNDISKEDSLENIQQKIWDRFYVQFCTGTSYNKGKVSEWIASSEAISKIIGTPETYKDIAKQIKSLLNE